MVSYKKLLFFPLIIMLFALSLFIGDILCAPMNFETKRDDNFSRKTRLLRLVYEDSSSKSTKYFNFAGEFSKKSNLKFDKNSDLHLVENASWVLILQKNASAKSFIHSLKIKNLIKYDKILLAYLQLFGVSKNLKAGIYEVHPQESFIHLVKRIVAFDVIKKTFQITPGNNNAQLKLKFVNADYLYFTNESWKNALFQNSNLLELCNYFPEEKKSSIKYSSKCAKQLQHNFEGLFLADSYQYNAGSDAAVILAAAHKNLTKCLFKFWRQRELDLPYSSPYELLIAASILEKEAAIKNEKKLIAGIIVNRLKNNMPLQMDPTVIYGLKNKLVGKLSHNDIQINSKYNTYKNKGLPPTPIAAVSCDSIEVASKPQKTQYLYFVANCKGGHLFAKTYAEHQKNINRACTSEI